jgi:hypothetical protein
MGLSLQVITLHRSAGDDGARAKTTAHVLIKACRHGENMMMTVSKSWVIFTDSMGRMTVQMLDQSVNWNGQQSQNSHCTIANRSMTLKPWSIYSDYLFVGLFLRVLDMTTRKIQSRERKAGEYFRRSQYGSKNNPKHGQIFTQAHQHFQAQCSSCPFSGTADR